MSSEIIGTPSTTYSGWLLAVIDAEPRTRTVMALPGLPAFWITWTPGARPARAASELALGVAVISSELMVLTAVVRLSRLTVPYPMLTSSSSSMGLRLREKSRVAASPAASPIFFSAGA